MKVKEAKWKGSSNRLPRLNWFLKKATFLVLFHCMADWWLTILIEWGKRKFKYYFLTWPREERGRNIKKRAALIEIVLFILISWRIWGRGGRRGRRGYGGHWWCLGPALLGCTRAKSNLQKDKIRVNKFVLGKKSKGKQSPFQVTQTHTHKKKNIYKLA